MGTNRMDLSHSHAVWYQTAGLTALRGQRTGEGWGLQRSIVTARPCPTPMHNAATPTPEPAAESWWATAPARRAPEHPSGCPMAIAPPCGLTSSGSRSGQLARQANDWAANASLSSIVVTSEQVRPAFASARLTASTG